MSYKYSCFAYRSIISDCSFIYDQGEVPGTFEAPKETKQSAGGSESVADIADKKKERGDAMIEAGARIPIPIGGEAEEGKVEDVDAAGGEVVARYVLTDPTKPYIALTFPLAVDYRSISIVALSGGDVSSELAEEVTITGGVGVEGGVPLGSVVTLYGGVGVEGGARVYDYVSAGTDGAADSGTDVSPTVAGFGSAGVRVNPVPVWHLYAGVKPTVTFTDGPGVKVPVVVGTGLTF